MKKFVLSLIILAALMAIGCSGSPPASDTGLTNVGAGNIGQGAISSGSGFFLTNNGVIVTNNHVVKDIPRITVVVNNNQYAAEILQRDETNDLAILKINYNNPYHFKVINFEPIRYGDTLNTFGFPYYVAAVNNAHLLEPGIRYTTGVLSAKVGSKELPGSFQHTVSVQSGNSGGPLFNSRNEVVGVVVSKFLLDLDNSRNLRDIPQLVNFGIKSDYIFPLLEKSNIRPGNGNIRNTNDAEKASVLILGYNTGINVINNTGYTGLSLNIRPAGTENWGRDLLGARTLRNGASFKIDSLPSSRNSRFDVRLVDRDNDVYTKTNITIQSNDIIIFTYNNDFVQKLASTVSTGINIVNNTGNIGLYLYVKPAETNDWGANLLGNELLLKGRPFAVDSLPSSRNNRYDIRLVDHENYTYIKTNIDFQPNETVTFTLDDFDIEPATRGSARGPSQLNYGPPVIIVNNTGYSVPNIYISPTMAENWGQDRLAANQTLENGQSVTINLPHPLSITNEYDFRLNDSNGNAYEKFNVTVTANGRIVFTQ